MSERAEKYEAFLDDLALVVEGDAEALERHADFLVDDDEARDLRHEAAEVVKELEVAGADYVHAADFEERFLAVLDGGLAEADDPGRTTNPGFAAPDLAPAPRAEDTAPEDAADEGTAQEEAPRATARTVELDQASLPGAEPTPEKEAPKARTEAPRRKGKLLLFPLIGGLALTAAAAAIGVAVFGPDDDASEEGPAVAAIGLEGTLVRVARAAEDGQSGVEIQRPGEDGFVPLVANGTIALARWWTDDRTRPGSRCPTAPTWCSITRPGSSSAATRRAGSASPRATSWPTSRTSRTGRTRPSRRRPAASRCSAPSSS
ncbi:MAG: hypothetical protein R3B82_26400 [Sandaracinaceae bacterium]